MVSTTVYLFVTSTLRRTKGTTRQTKTETPTKVVVLHHVRCGTNLRKKATWIIFGVQVARKGKLTNRPERRKGTPTETVMKPTRTDIEASRDEDTTARCL